MAACGNGAIDNLSSREASSSLARGNLAYSVTKAGIDQLTRQLISEWGGGIRINAVARATSSVPRDGKVAYRYVARRWQRGTPIPRRHPVGRLAEPTTSHQQSCSAGQPMSFRGLARRGGSF